MKYSEGPKVFLDGRAMRHDIHCMTLDWMVPQDQNDAIIDITEATKES